MLLLVRRDHLVYGILEHFSTFLDGFTFDHYLRPFDQLSHVTRVDFRIFGGVCT